LNSQGFKTSRGNEFNKNSLRRILLNKRYIGTYTYKGKETPNAIPRIISDELFNKAQEQMAKNKKAPARARAKVEYLLTTKLFCGYCKSLMVGISGTSKTSKKYNYYSCNKARKKLCDKKAVSKEYIEEIVIKEARAILTKENINEIVREVVALTEKEKDNTNLKRLNKIIKANDKRKNNLIKAVSECDIESVRKELYEELAIVNNRNIEIQKEALEEEKGIVKLSASQVRFFLTRMKKGCIEGIKYKKMLINTLVNEIYLYDDMLTIVFNTQDKPVKIDVSLIEEIEKVRLKECQLHQIKI